MANQDVAAALGIDADKVGRWRTRYAREGRRAIENERPRGANHGGKDSPAQVALRAKVIGATGQNDTGGRQALIVPVGGAPPGHHAQLRQPGVARTASSRT